MKVHFISIGGSVMHNLAIALSQKGYEVSGSDDEIYNPARSRLQARGLLPDEEGWDPARITEDLDFVILGMHARENNPELQRVRALGLKIYSFPEYIGEYSRDKLRVVVAGSHGKTTTTAMIMHVLRQTGKSYDYMVGAQLEGFDLMVKLSDAPLIILEGDEYLSSAIDREPKFVHYHPSVLVVTGIAWDHMNVFPTFDQYLAQFHKLFRSCPEGARVFYYEDDIHIRNILPQHAHLKTKGYAALDYKPVSQGSMVRWNGFNSRVSVFGRHNMENLQAARLVCGELGIDDQVFFEAIEGFRGASKRLEKLAEKGGRIVYRDFAHAPSKVEATLKAVRNQYPDKRLIACAELHTYSSLNKDFLPLYAGSLDGAELAAVYYSPHTLKMKKMPAIEKSEMNDFFQRDDLQVFTESEALQDFVTTAMNEDSVLLMMGSGTFGGIDLKAWADRLVGQK